jgi:hypothetical protein
MLSEWRGMTTYECDMQDLNESTFGSVGDTAPQELRLSCSRVTLWAITHLGVVDIRGDQNVSVHLMITV